MKKIIPMQDFVVMERQAPKLALALPDGVQPPKSFTIVTAIGPTVKTISIGDRIVTIPSAMIQINMEDGDQNREFFIAKEEHVIGVIQEDADKD
jgi:hypothetical protein